MKQLFKVIVIVFAFFSTNVSAGLLEYNVTLTADYDFTAFGGGVVGDTFSGTFSIDDSLVGGDDVFDPGLTGTLLFFNFNLGGTIFSDSTVIGYDNGLRFEGGPGPLLDIAFDLENPNGDTLSILTAFEDTSEWIAIEGDAGSVEGSTFPTSVTFAPVPIPAAVWLFGSGLIGLVGLAKRKA